MQSFAPVLVLCAVLLTPGMSAMGKAKKGFEKEETF